MVALVPVVFCVGGLVIYVLSANGKVAELGRLVFACAFLALMIALSAHTINLLGR